MAQARHTSRCRPDVFNLGGETFYQAHCAGCDYFSTRHERHGDALRAYHEAHGNSRDNRRR